MALLVAGYFLDTTQQQIDLKKVTAEEEQLRLVFSGKQAKAANLEAYKQQLDEIVLFYLFHYNVEYHESAREIFIG